MGRLASPATDAWRQLDGFLAIVSHDLRSPLSAISVGIDAMADPAMDQATRDRYLSAMRRAVGRTERFLADLADVGRIASGSLEIEPARIAIAPLLERAASQHEAEAHETGTWIVVEADGGIHPLKADPDRLLQALDKLISNAMRHARGSGAITLRAENRDGPEGDTVRLWVIDHGPGVAGAEIERILHRFWSGARERGKSAGLGLPLVSGIAAAHGGAMLVESSPGGGASFGLELPAVR
ncbi:MAG TPA: HAMP domain-containing sensor histidine kinase [Kofleriaceae bacterium]|nr:HAMP domain-containing sensor histidine kinase [Kofleriaceae bacterium]